jgi:hypothetical protein
MHLHAGVWRVIQPGFHGANPTVGTFSFPLHQSSVYLQKIGDLFPDTGYIIQDAFGNCLPQAVRLRLFYF